jgi:hypothetical protein
VKFHLEIWYFAQTNKRALLNYGWIIQMFIIGISSNKNKRRIYN